MATNGSPETQDLNTKVRISSLSELKRELGLTLDTSGDIDFKEQISLEFTRGELNNLRQEISVEGVNKAAKLKEILKAKQSQITQDTRREVSFLGQEFIRENPTPDGMKKAFEYLEKNQIKGAHRYMILSAILDKFIYSNSLTITDLDVVDDKGRVNIEYSAILNKNLTKEDIKQVQIFQLSLREGGVSKRANEIAEKYGINLSYKNEKEKQQIKAQILGNHDIPEIEKALLLEFIDGKHNKVDKQAQDYSKQIGKGIEKNSKELQEIGINTTTEKIANYARNPDQLIGDVVKSISNNPITLVSTIGLVLGKIFGFNAFGKDGHFLMKLFVFGTFGGIVNDIYKGTGFNNLIGDSIEGKNGVRNGVANGFKKAGDAVSWSWNKIKGLPTTLQSGGEALVNQLSLWYYANNYQIVDSTGTEKSLLDSNYSDIQSKINRGTFVNDLKPIPEPAKIEGKGVVRVQNQLIALETEGIKKFGTKQKFDNEVRGKSITEVIGIVHMGKAA